MTDWRLVYSDYSNKPELVDTTSSPTTVYLHKDIEEVEIPDPMNEGETRKQWKYFERTCTQEEYNIAMLSSELSATAIELKHDTEVIDNFTATLIEEGIL